MPICIECRYPLKTLYTTYSKADDRALGKGVRLTQCPRCRRFGDKYVEHDFVVVFIDLVLVKPQVYRHLLFNRLGGGEEKGKVDRSIIRLGILLLLFDVYLTWSRIEKLPLPSASNAHNNNNKNPQINSAILQTYPLLLQYLFFLLLVLLTTLSTHLPIRLLTSIPPPRLPTPVRKLYTSLIPYYPYPTPLSTALLVSSCTKLFPILLIIWEYDLRSSATAVSWAVIVNNVAALEILMGCGYFKAGVLVAVAQGVSGVVSGMVLRAAGLGTEWETGVWWEVVRVGWEWVDGLGWGG